MITLFTLGAVVFAGLAFWETKRQADIAQAALIQADRPWLEITNLPSFALTIKKGTAIAQAQVNVRNVGHSPAEHVFIASIIVDTGLIIDERRDALYACNFAKSFGNPLVEYLVFPDETAILPIKSDNTRANKIFYLSVAGCVAYQLGGQQIVGRTAFIYRLGQTCAAQPVLGCPIDLSKDATYAGPALKTTVSIGGTFAD